MRVILLSILILVLNNLGFSQAKAEVISHDEMIKILASLGKFYQNTNSYQFDTYYASYKGHESTVPYEESRGYIKKSDNNFHAEVMGSKSIQSNGYMITIQPETKQLLVNNSQSFTSSAVNLDELKLGLSRTIRIERSVFGKTANFILYYREGTTISHTEIAINELGYLEKIIFYYREKIDWKNNEGKIISSQPKLEIKYLNFKKDITISAKEFDWSNYLIITESSLQASVNYRNYEIIDLRIKN
jgi:outer membrane lipoprotein-sorting protein